MFVLEISPVSSYEIYHLFNTAENKTEPDIQVIALFPEDNPFGRTFVYYFPLQLVYILW